MAIRLESPIGVPGASSWSRQPVVMGLLVVDARMDADASGRLQAAFAEWCRVPATGELAGRVAGIVQDLQKRTGLPLFARVQLEAVPKGSWRIVVPTIAGAHAPSQRMLSAAVDLADAAVRGDPVAPAQDLLRMAIAAVRKEAPVGKNVLPLLAEADRRGIPWERMGGNLYRLGHGVRSRWFNSTLTDRTSSLGVHLARSKFEAATLLRRQNIPVPAHLPVADEDQAVAAAARLGWPVVVKPADQDQGMGVASRLRTEEAVRLAYRGAARFSRKVLVEKHFFGEDYRIHVFEGQVFRVRHRVPGGVTGDGRSSVAQLLARLNADPLRGPPGSGADLVRIDMDGEALEMLAERGLAPDAVPEAGDFVQLRRIANVSVGGVSQRVDMADVHPDNLALAVRAVGTLRLDLAAVDFLIPDIRKSWMEVGAAICEINAQPQFGEDAPAWLFDRIFPGHGRIPVVAVDRPYGWLGTLRERLAAAGVRLGFCDASGTWIGSERLAAQLPILHAGSILLGDTTVEAVLMVADPSLLRQGMPTDRFDAVVIDERPGDPGHRQLASVLARLGTRVLRVPKAGPQAVVDTLGAVLKGGGRGAAT
jgi:cyanophycin synthetase